MADENDPLAVTDTAAPAPAVKKQRAPRRKKADIEAAASTSNSIVVKSPRGRRKRVEKDAAAAATEQAPAKRGRPAASAKIAGAKRGRKSASQSAFVPSSAADEMADLLQLEEENKRLRQDLAEKLRSENADLRRRLGIK